MYINDICKSIPDSCKNIQIILHGLQRNFQQHLHILMIEKKRKKETMRTYILASENKFF